MENCYVSDDNEWNAKERIYLFNAELNPKHLYKELEWYDLIEFFGGNDSVKLFFSSFPREGLRWLEFYCIQMNWSLLCVKVYLDTHFANLAKSKIFMLASEIKFQASNEWNVHIWQGLENSILPNTNGEVNVELIFWGKTFPI